MSANITPRGESRKQLLFNTLRQANAEAVFNTLEPREQITPEAIEGIGHVCGLTPEQVELALDDLAQAERIRLEVRGSQRYVCRTGKEAQAA